MTRRDLARQPRGAAVRGLGDLMAKSSKAKSAPGVRPRANRDGSTSFQIRWQSRDGRTQSATRDTFEEAVEFRQERLREIRRGASGDLTAGRLAFGSWFEDHHLPAKERTGRPSTHDTRRSYYRNHIAPTWGQWALADIAADDIEEWLLEKGEVLKVASVRKVFGYFAQAMERAHVNERIIRNPAAAIDLVELGFGTQSSQPCFLDPVEALILEEAFDPHWRLTVPFSTDSGLRIGELGALRVDRVDLLRGIVRVDRTLTKGEGGVLVEGPPKTAAGKRVVPTLGPDVVDRLRDHIRERGLGPNDYLFHGERGGRMNPDDYRSRVFNPAVQRAGLEGRRVTPHALRHTAVSLWIASDLPPVLRTGLVW